MQERKSESVTFRLTASERAALEAAAASAAASESDYLRALVRDRELSVARLPLDGARLDEAVLALKRSGNCLNQVARRLNSGGGVPAAEAADALRAHREAAEALSALIAETRLPCW